MAGKKSLPDISQKVIADVEGYINDFKRANRAQKSMTAEMDRELDKFTKGIKKKFSFGDVGKDMMKGFGIGSGFAVAEKAASMVVAHFEKAAKFSEEIAANSERELAATLKGISARQNEFQREKTRDDEYARMGRELANLKAPIMVKGGGRGFGPKVEREKTASELKAISDLTVKYQELGAEIDASRAKADEAEAARVHALDIATAEFEGDYTSRRMAAKNDTNNWAVKQVQEEEEKRAKASLDLWESTALAKRKALEDQILSGNAIFLKNQEETARKADAISKDMARSINRAADEIGDAWVDALNGVEDAWGNLGRTVLREIEGMVAKVLLVTPLMHGIGAVFGSFGGGAGGLFSTLATAFAGYGKPAADGGYRDGSQPYLVGEEGPEIFNPGRAGTITPNSALRSGGAGGNTYVIDARGADAGAVDRIATALRQLAGPGVVEQRALSAVNNHLRRGGQLA